MRRIFLFALSWGAFLQTAAEAAETVTYSYDTRGRLVQVQRTGPAAKTTAYALDRAGNRTTKTTSAP